MIAGSTAGDPRRALEREERDGFPRLGVGWADADLVAGMVLRMGGDEREHVARWASGRFDVIVGARQVHGEDVGRIDRPHPTEIGSCPERLDIDSCDGLVTATAGVLLTVKTADCVPVLVYAPDQRAIGLVHAGWRGVAAEILPRAIETLADAYGADAGTCRMYCGPAVGPCCYPVGPEVVAAIGETRAGGGGRRWDRDGQVDLRAALANQAVAIGLAPAAVTLSDECTACDPERFHSYRRDGPTGGRMLFHAGIAGMPTSGGCGEHRKT